MILEGAKRGAEGQNRTVDTSLFRAVLCQLSYLGTVRGTGLRGTQARSVKIDRRILPRSVVEVPHILYGKDNRLDLSHGDEEKPRLSASRQI